MAKSRKTARVIPGARRLIESLRDLGYEAPDAVADLVDNCIAADASNVEITFHFDGADSWIRIADDGVGMPAREITEAMRYGTERDYEDGELGKFGLGLKTASMSQCRRLTVASRTAKAAARFETRQLDLDYVAEHNTWDILILGADERPDAVTDPLQRHPGTVVLWEDLDRILSYNDPAGGWAERYLLALAEQVEQHLAMVFHRFLAGAVKGRRKLAISLNGNAIGPWDPFARDEPETKSLKVEDIPLNTANGSGLVRMEPFILPPRSAFSTEAAHKRYSGPNNWNRQQGFYIYRADRLIQSGGWSYMRTADEHTKLSRVGLYFSTDLDEAFGINVAKMRVSLPTELKELMEAPVSKAVRAARAIYDAKPDRPKPQRKPQSAPGPPPKSTAAAPTGNPAGGPNPQAEDQDDRRAIPTVVSRIRREALERAAEATGDEPALDRIVRALKVSEPEAAHDLGF